MGGCGLEEVEEVGDEEDEEDGAEADAGAAAVSPAAMAVVSATASEEKDQEDDHDEGHVCFPFAGRGEAAVGYAPYCSNIVEREGKRLVVKVGQFLGIIDAAFQGRFSGSAHGWPAGSLALLRDMLTKIMRRTGAWVCNYPFTILSRGIDLNM